MKRFLSTFGLLIAEAILVFWTVLCACIFQYPLNLWEIPMLFACVLWIPGLSKVIWDKKCGRGYYTNPDKRKNVKKNQTYRK